MTKTAAVSLDLDNKWSYLKTHGDPQWVDLPSYLPKVIPRILSTASDFELQLTVMVVGLDAAQPENGEGLISIVEGGHSLGNHSYHHEPWLHLYDEKKLRDDFDRAEDAIHRATAQRPLGFRGPGFSLSMSTLRELEKRGYIYDATVFPNALNPVGRMYYFSKANLTPEEKEKRKALFGTLGDALRPNAPFWWDFGDKTRLLEIPVTTMPLFRVPIHMSYILYAASISPTLARFYLRTGLSLCSLTGNPPSILLHPLDFLGADDEPDLSFFPGMSMQSAQKLSLLETFLAEIASSHSMISLDNHALTLDPSKSRQPKFSHDSLVAD